MVTCEKTGAVVYFPQFDTYVRGDVHSVDGSSYILYGNEPYRSEDESPDFTMYDAWHRPTQPYQVWVSRYLHRMK